MKAVILRSNTGNSNEVINKLSKDGYKTVKPSYFPPIKFTKDHLHECLTKLISVFFI